MENTGKMNSVFDVYTSPGKGLGLKAKQNILPGETVLIEEAFCHVLTRKERGLKCDFCLQDGSSLLKCSRCKLMHYCGINCQRKDWTSHKEECKCLQKVQPKRPPDICLLAARFLTKINKTKPDTRTRKIQQIIEFQNNITKKDGLIDGKRKEMFFTFAFVLQQFAEASTFANLNLKPSHSFGLLCWLTCNCFTILNAEMVSVGIGIYDYASLVNHSCRPNCVAVFDSSTISIRPVKPTSQGEEITISYIECLETTKNRQSELEDRYFFRCQCSRCDDDDKDLNQSAFGKCKKCNQPVRVNLECTECVCGFADFPKDYCKLVEQEENKLKSSLENCKECMTAANFENLQTAVQKASSSCIPDESILMTHCYEALFDGCIEFEKWQLAVEYGLIILKVYLVYYEELHPSTGIHLFKLGKLKLYLDNLHDGVEFLQRAKKILNVTHGKNHQLMSELEEMLLQVIREINETNNYKALDAASG